MKVRSMWTFLEVSRTATMEFDTVELDVLIDALSEYAEEMFEGEGQDSARGKLAVLMSNEMLDALNALTRDGSQ